MSQNGTYRIGTGAGFSSDRLDPAIDLVKRGSSTRSFLSAWAKELWLSGIVTERLIPTSATTPYLKPGSGPSSPCARHTAPD